MIGIHSGGDLRLAEQTGDMLYQIAFGRSRPSLTRNPSTEVLLDEPLEIGVGGLGIIGRKISVWRNMGNGEGERVAEGIVGFN